MAKHTGWGPLSTLSRYDEVLAALNPTAWWKMDETSGTTAHDSSGNGHDATVVGGVTPGSLTTPPPMQATAFNFDGSTGELETTAFNPSGLSKFSMVAWAQSQPGSWAPAVLTTGDAYNDAKGFIAAFGSPYGWQFQYAGTTSGGGSNAPTARESSVLGPGWFFLAGTVDITLPTPTITCYVKSPGDQTQNSNFSAPVSTDTLVLGQGSMKIGGPYGSDSFYPGLLCQVAWWSGVALSSTQLLDLWAAA